MKYVLGAVLVVGLVLSIWWVLTPPEKEGPGPTPASAKEAKQTVAPVPLPAGVDIPETIVFENSYGKSTFTHKQHYERVGNHCETCHTQVFPMSREPINYGKALHRAAEADGKACAACHRVGGTSFAADSNCVKCHESKEK